MPKMQRDDAFPLIEFLAKQVVSTSSSTAVHHAFHPWETFVVRECSQTLAAVRGWVVKALFVAYDDLRHANRPYLTVLYRMACGTLLVLQLPKLPISKLSYLQIPEKDVTFQGEDGFKVGIDCWYIVGDANDFVVKKGPQKRQHLARKPCG
jgi:hypothetical protein